MQIITKDKIRNGNNFTVSMFTSVKPYHTGGSLDSIFVPRTPKTAAHVDVGVNRSPQT